jgi:modification methylase
MAEPGPERPRSLVVDDQTAYFCRCEDLDFLPEESVDFFMTSPPYWNLKNYGHPEEIGQENYETYLERLNAVWAACYRLARPDAVLVVNVANRRYKKRFYPLAMDIAARMKGWTLWDMPIWYIPNALPQQIHYQERLMDNKYENLLVFTKDGSVEYEFHKPRVPQKYATKDPRTHNKNPNGRCIGNVIRIPAYRPPNVKELGYHVAAYPEELVALMLESYTSPGSVVLDPFLGSGTTLKVCRGMGRRGIGIELNPDFAPLLDQRIRERWETPDWRSLDILHSASMTVAKSDRRTWPGAPGASDALTGQPGAL